MQRYMGMIISNSQGGQLGFSLRSTPYHLWVTWVYIVWVQKVCIRQYSLAEQNVSRVSRGKTLPTRYSQDTAISICTDSSHFSHVQGICITSRDARLQDTHESLFSLQQIESSHSLSITQPSQSNPTINTGYKRLNKITIKFGTE